MEDSRDVARDQIVEVACYKKNEIHERWDGHGAPQAQRPKIKIALSQIRPYRTDP